MPLQCVTTEGKGDSQNRRINTTRVRILREVAKGEFSRPNRKTGSIIVAGKRWQRKVNAVDRIAGYESKQL